MQLSFNSLYPNIICGMVEAGIHKTAKENVQKSLESFKESFEYFDLNKRNLKLNDPDKYLEQKKNINSIKYGGDLASFVKRPEIELTDCIGIFPELNTLNDKDLKIIEMEI